MALGPGKSNPVPLIIFVVLFVFSAVGLVLVSMELSDARNQMNEGFIPRSAEDRQIDTKDKLKLTLKQVRERNKKLVANALMYETLIGVKSPVEATKAKEDLIKTLEDLKDFPGDPSLLMLIDKLETAKNTLRSRLEKALTAAEDQNRQLKKNLEIEQQKVVDKQTIIDQRNDELDKLKKDMLTAREGAKTEADGLRAELATAQKTMQTEIKSLKGIVQAKERVIRAQEERIKVLLKSKLARSGEGAVLNKEAEKADGTVLRVDKHTGVVINIGGKEGVRRGLCFEVYTQKADGTRIYRGKIEVKTVYPNISQAILIGDGDVVDLIGRGDIIMNIAFEPGSAKIFAVDNVFSEAKKQAFREALAQYGSRLVEEVTVRTDYLIIGAQKGNLRPEAEKLGIPMISEDDLNTFIAR